MVPPETVQSVNVVLLARATSAAETPSPDMVALLIVRLLISALPAFSMKEAE